MCLCDTFSSAHRFVYFIYSSFIFLYFYMFAALLLFASQEKECIFASRFLSLMFLFIRLFVLMHVYGGGGTCRWPDVAHSIFFCYFYIRWNMCKCQLGIFIFTANVLCCFPREYNFSSSSGYERATNDLKRNEKNNNNNGNDADADDDKVHFAKYE